MKMEGIILQDKRKNTAAAVGVPLAAISTCPKTELVGNREAVVDGCRGVAEYGDTLIRLNISGGSICFHGTDMEITCLYNNEATLKGFFTKIEFCL